VGAFICGHHTRFTGCVNSGLWAAHRETDNTCHADKGEVQVKVEDKTRKTCVREWGTENILLSTMHCLRCQKTKHHARDNFLAQDKHADIIRATYSVTLLRTKRSTTTNQSG